MYDSDSELETTEISSTAATRAQITSKTRRPLGVKDSDDCMRVLTKVFGHSSYKGKQKEIVEAAYGGADVLVVAPTGMGKSLCFQVPAIADKRGLSVVVSPLLALMDNQIESLRMKNIEVAALSSDVLPAEQAEICRDLQLYETRIKLLYVTPERLGTAEFMKILDVIHENHNLNRLVVDEAHCISEWGHDFRADYRKIGNFRNRYPEVPIMALTATATPAVQRDMVKSLKLLDDHLFTALHPFNRENLFYEVRYLSNPDQLNQMADIFDTITGFYRRRGRSSSGIVYCRYKKTCDEISSYLRGRGVHARPYHRGVPSKTLKKTLQEWTKNEGVDVVVATIAFGLGIDKGDVRYIIHYDLPKSFEGYYQETGRAGRDGNPSRCILYYSREDAIRVKNFIRSSNPNRVRDEEDDEPTPTQRASGSQHSLVDYAESSTICRHVLICKYFGEDIDESNPEIVKKFCNGMCDICKSPEKVLLRMLKLSSKQEAAHNVPISRPNPVNVANSNTITNSAPVGRQGKFNEQENVRGSLLGTTKRSNTDFAEGSSSKKPKVAALPPMLVTRPYASASGLLKPFKAPSFVSKASTATATDPETPSISLAPRKEPRKITASSSRTNQESAPRQAVAAPEPMTIETEELNNESDGEEFELPEVNLHWLPEDTTKISIVEREQSFKTLRRKLHQLLFMKLEAEAIWDKLYDKSMVDDKRRNQIIFKTASDLEQTAISLSSTAEGYDIRIQCIKEDIIGLTELHLWDSKKSTFEDRQEIVDILRRYTTSSMKKK